MTSKTLWRCTARLTHPGGSFSIKDFVTQADDPDEAVGFVHWRAGLDFPGWKVHVIKATVESA